MHYSNPIIPGFRPDPSICRVGKDFYLVTSSFEYFPGIPIYHSRDLVHWEQIGHVLTRNSQVQLMAGAPNCINIYAPTIRYNMGVFYVIVTNVTGDNRGNFYVTSTDPAREWSDPIALPFEGIDPSLFFDDDDRVYYTGTDNGIYLHELDITTGEPIGEKIYIWQGMGNNNPEAPHIYKMNGTYYIMLAEGGTELCHMATVARSRNILGPYKECPKNPVLTNIGTALPIKAAGHADLVEDGHGNWWAVHLGIRPISYPFRHNLGREVMLVPVRWRNGWPVMGDNGACLPEFELDRPYREFRPSGYVPGSNMTDFFNSGTLHPSWNVIYNPIGGVFALSDDGLKLFGNEVALSEDSPKAWLGRRQEHFECICETKLTFSPRHDGEEAGMTVYMNPGHHYEIYKTRRDGLDMLCVRRKIGKLEAVEASYPYSEDSVILMLAATKESYEFYFRSDDGTLVHLGGGEAGYLTTEVGGCFTGNYIALFASGNGTRSKAAAVFEYFSYVAEELDEQTQEWTELMPHRQAQHTEDAGDAAEPVVSGLDPFAVAKRHEGAYEEDFFAEADAPEEKPEEETLEFEEREITLEDSPAYLYTDEEVEEFEDFQDDQRERLFPDGEYEEQSLPVIDDILAETDGSAGAEETQEEAAASAEEAAEEAETADAEEAMEAEPVPEPQPEPERIGDAIVVDTHILEPEQAEASAQTDEDAADLTEASEPQETAQTAEIPADEADELTGFEHLMELPEETPAAEDGAEPVQEQAEAPEKPYDPIEERLRRRLEKLRRQHESAEIISDMDAVSSPQPLPEQPDYNPSEMQMPEEETPLYRTQGQNQTSAEEILAQLDQRTTGGSAKRESINDMSIDDLIRRIKK